MAGRSKSTFKLRSQRLKFALGLLIVVAGLRAADVAVIRSSSLTAEAARQQSATAIVPAPRGDITDRHGVELAVSQPAVDVTADPMLVKDPNALAAQLAPLLGKETADLLPKLSDSKKGYVVLAKRIPAAQGDKVRKLGVEGINFEPSMRRAYPRGEQAGRLIGSVNYEGHGSSGLEYAWDSVLRGKDGKRTVLSDGHGKPLGVQELAPTVPGRQLTLTIDAAVQDQVERVLAGVGQTFQPKGATAIVMDPNSGEILALANWPAVNANDSGAALAEGHRDMASGFNYEPGSTFKSITVASALSDHKVTPDTVFDLPVELQVGDKTIHDSHDRGPESLSVSGILAQSSNVGAALIGTRVGRVRLDHWIRAFGFGSPTHSGFPGEERGILLPLSKYSLATVGNESMGQGLSVTPLQMVQAYSAIANGGVLRSPAIVHAVDGKPAPTRTQKRVITPHVAAQVRKMLQGVVAEGGTASGAEIQGFDLAGKTGTAQKVDPQTGTYSESKYIASFIGFAPAKSPKLLAAVVVDEPNGDIYGGSVAAPAFSRIMAFALPYLGISPR